MATNEVIAPRDTLSLACTHPTTPEAGGPVIFGVLPGVALTKEGEGGNKSTEATVALDGVFKLSVKGADGSGNAAVTAGDRLYYKSDATPVINKNSGGVPFGIALEGVGSGSTATIKVKVG